MAQKKQLTEDIAVNKDFKLLTRSYQEHAIGQINFARYSVLASREFAKDLEDIFGNVKTSYKNKILRANVKNIVKKNGKDVWVLITANNKLYGDIILKTCQLFLGHIRLTDLKKIDLIVIGRQGKDYIDQSKLQIPYKYYELPDSNVNVEYLKKLSTNFISYENVIVFYGKFDNIVSQTPTETTLSGAVTDDKIKSFGISDSSQVINERQKRSYLFEPSLEEIVIFFESQILSLLMNQTVQEAQLARFASRINAMEIAQNNIQKQLVQLKKKEKMFKNMEMNKKQLELLAGRALWTSK